jgi:hypothetical protein
MISGGSLMPKPCTICEHPRHDEIDRRARIEKDIAKIAKEFSLSYPALYRHISANHHIREVTTIPTSSELATSEDIYKEIEKWHSEAKDLQKTAKANGDIKTALLGLDKALRCLELMAKIHGQIPTGPQITIINNPEWVELRTLVIKALEPYPAAREAVVDAIRK